MVCHSVVIKCAVGCQMIIQKEGPRIPDNINYYQVNIKPYDGCRTIRFEFGGIYKRFSGPARIISKKNTQTAKDFCDKYGNILYDIDIGF